VNCLHEFFYETAVADAKRLDEYLAQHKKPVGPLHGVPISLKDQFHVKGVETSMGYLGWYGTFEGNKGDPRYGVFESEMVRELRGLGAVLFCKTSVPHTLMTGETVNNIIGYTWNPNNRNLSSGGSSGGEGALIGLRGSPAGFGTDIGGSIRIPAAFNGLYGIRPSSGRLPYEGVANSMDGQNSVVSVVGPLATTVGALKLVFKSILSQQPWFHDPFVIEMPWRDAEEQEIHDLAKSSSSGGQLVIGVLRDDGVVTPQPPVARAVEMVIAVLSKAGHKVLEWKPPSHQTGMDLIFQAWLYDGGADIHRAFALTGEPMSKQIGVAFGSEPRPQADASHIAANNVRIRAYRKEYMDYWNSTTVLTGTGRPIDAFVMPLAPYATARPLMYEYYGYSAIINALDYPAIVVPVTNADKTVDVVDKSFKPLSDADQVAFEAYDAEMYDGAHVSVQLVGRRLQEEKMLALAEYLSGLLKN
jgi:amidase